MKNVETEFKLYPSELNTIRKMLKQKYIGCEKMIENKKADNPEKLRGVISYYKEIHEKCVKHLDEIGFNY